MSDTLRNPYVGKERRAFWRDAVSGRSIAVITDLYRPKFEIDKNTRVATAGSCFAQHIAANLRSRGFKVIDTEPPPPGLIGDQARQRGYLLYSARYGNIYTVRHFLQLVRESFGAPPGADGIWQKGGAYFDAFRPSIEPGGLRSPSEVIAHRHRHLAAVRTVVETMEVLVFTLGLTEAWEDKVSGAVFPTAPGVIAGKYEADRFLFRNYTHAEILGDFIALREVIHAVNPRARFILTVSPVPLAATASHNHVLTATTYSKSVLRAVAGELEVKFADVDYFPSYELIASPVSGGIYYDRDHRGVTPEGVKAAMSVFFARHDPGGRDACEDAEGSAEPSHYRSAHSEIDGDDAICEDALLDAFAPRTQS